MPKKQPKRKINQNKSTDSKNSSSRDNSSSLKKSTSKPKNQGSQQKKEDKRDFLPGQKYKTPDEESGALAFYKSLYEQNPKSEMARQYCLQYGVLDPQQACKLLKELSKQRGKK